MLTITIQEPQLLLIEYDVGGGEKGAGSQDEENPYLFTFMWDLRLSLRAQRKGHKGHWWLFKPVWMTMCLFQ